jgi:hypothetical protein
MNTIKLIAVIAFGACTLKLAGFEENQRLDLHLLDGRKIENARITAIEADRIIAINREGAHTIRKDELAHEHQKALGWSSEASAAHRAQVEGTERQAALKKAEEDKIAELEEQIASVTIDAAIRILQVTEDGFLCKAGYGVFGPTKERTIPARYVDDQLVHRETHRGLDGPKTYTRVDKFKRMVSPERKEKYRSTYQFDDIFFVEAPTRGYVDDDTWKGELWPHGTYAYTNTAGARRTVKRYTAYAPEYVLVALNELEKLKEPNKAMQPTPVDVTDRANARSAPSTSAADL